MVIVCLRRGASLTTRVITSELDRQHVMQLIENQKLPFTIDITKGKRRSVEQNRLQRVWLNEISEQLGDQTPEEVRGYCKLTLGVPILRAENEGFREKYDTHVKGLPYETKVAIMMEPLDLPVTRLMTTEQKARYLDLICHHFGQRGIVLAAHE